MVPGMVAGVSTLGLVLIAWGVLLALLVLWLWRRGGISPAEEDPRVQIAHVERRRGWDRRRVDLGPPDGVPDRRHVLDRRVTAAGF